jgi:MFS transporter, DHA2 family, multidrug resistance protein
MVAEAAAADTGLPGARRWLALSAAMLGTTVYMLTMTLSGAALPHMQGAFSAAPDQMAWLLTSFIIGTTIMTACSGWVAVRFGRTRLYCVSAAGFVISSILCGFSTSLEEALIFRTIQGICGAPLSPLGQAIAIDSFPRRKQGLAVAMWSFGGMAGSAIGPFYAGALIEDYGWPWVFFVNVPLGALAFLAAWAFVPEIETDKARRFNWFGFIVLVVAICGFELMLNRGEQRDWFDSTEIVLEAAIGGFALYVFAMHLWLSRRPFFDPAILMDRNYAFGLTIIFVYGMICFLQMFLMPILLQDLAGYGIGQVGELLAWRALGSMTGMLVVSQVSDRIDPRIVLVGGFACLIGSAWAMSDWTLEVSAFDVVWAIYIQGMGAAVTYVPISMMAFATLPDRQRNEGMALFFLVTNLGTATGTAIIFNVLSRGMRVNHDSMSEVLTPFNELFKHGGLPGLWNLTSPGGLAAMDAEIGRQAAMIAYNNSFYLIALTALVVLPVAAFVRLPKRP